MKTPPDRLLRYAEAAAFLSISQNALRIRVCKGQLKPLHRVGRSVWFSKEDLVKQLEQKTRDQERRG